MVGGSAAGPDPPSARAAGSRARAARRGHTAGSEPACSHRDHTGAARAPRGPSRPPRSECHPSDWTRSDAPGTLPAAGEGVDPGSLGTSRVHGFRPANPYECPTSSAFSSPPFPRAAPSAGSDERSGASAPGALGQQERAHHPGHLSRPALLPRTRSAQNHRPPTPRRDTTARIDVSYPGRNSTTSTRWRDRPAAPVGIFPTRDTTL